MNTYIWQLIFLMPYLYNKINTNWIISTILNRATTLRNHVITHTDGHDGPIVMAAGPKAVLFHYEELTKFDLPKAQR